MGKHTEELFTEAFVDKLRPYLTGFSIKQEQHLQYMQIYRSIDKNGFGVNEPATDKKLRGYSYFCADILICENNTPRIAIEVKTKDSDFTSCFDNAKRHKIFFPYLQYGCLLLESVRGKTMPRPYYIHKHDIDFEDVFEPNYTDEQVKQYAKKLKELIKKSRELEKIFFFDS